MTTITGIKHLSGKRVAVIGAGLFGVEAAIRLSEYGADVVIYEQTDDILKGASYINQNRMHMGYHYPRSIETGIGAHVFTDMFCHKYPACIVRNFAHYYAIAKTGSAITGKQYLERCYEMGLPYVSNIRPVEFKLNMRKIDTCIQVDEPLIDVDVLRVMMRQTINRLGIKVLYKRKISKINYDYINKPFGWYIESDKYDLIINSTYGNINTIAESSRNYILEYQYELCEVPIISVPWPERAGIGIMDGPFFGVLPFGFGNEYMLWDVETSVLERTVGKHPRFNRINKHKENEARRFKKYIAKATGFIPAMAKAKHLRSMYVVKVVLPEHDHDDSRPTQIIDHGYGFYSVFSGKLCMAIPTADRLANIIAGAL